LQRNAEQESSGQSFHRIVVAVDGSANAERAAQMAAGLARKHNSELIVVYALTSSDIVATSSTQSYMPKIDYSSAYYLEALKQGNKLVDQTVEFAKKQGVSARGVVDRSVSSTVEAIINQATNLHADLIVIGTRGIGGFKRLLLGSVSSGVVSHAPCSVLVVR
jgi:nucleotide-binding universal stress UspA family protein